MKGMNKEKKHVKGKGWDGLVVVERNAARPVHISSST